MRHPAHGAKLGPEGRSVARTLGIHGGLVFSTCLFCHGALGRNQLIEAFPVGRRLAFDVERGRLWVVCRSCDNWNLSPLEERWEAVESCERLYRGTTIRVSTENIGLATMAEGTDLVRVGKPLRPEFAAWRYGSRIRKRRLRGLGAVAARVATDSAAMAVGSMAALCGVAFTLTGNQFIKRNVVVPMEQAEARISFSRVLARVRTPEGELRPLRFSEVARLEIIEHSPDAPWVLRVAHGTGQSDFSGADAAQVAGHLLSNLNVDGVSRVQIREATNRIAHAGDAERFIRQSGNLRESRRRKNTIFWNDDVGVLGLTTTERLALEIAVHEDAERHAMQGELQALEDAWRDAEEIAAIADRMFLPD
jgi:hypothetical protein